VLTDDSVMSDKITDKATRLLKQKEVGKQNGVRFCQKALERS